jgi:hypothetical protein
MTEGAFVMADIEAVVLTRDVAEHGLESGDVGAVVYRYADGACEVEFVNAVGITLAVLTLSSADVRPLGRSDILHARAMGGV